MGVVWVWFMRRLSVVCHRRNGMDNLSIPDELALFYEFAAAVTVTV